MKEAVFSPDLQHKVSFGSYEISMSHWIDQPYLIRISDDACLFDLSEEAWSASTVRWFNDSTVELYLRKYPGLIDCTLVLNILTNQAEVVSRTNSVAGTFSAVNEWILNLK